VRLGHSIEVICELFDPAFSRAEGGPAPSTGIDDERLETACPQAVSIHEMYSSRRAITRRRGRMRVELNALAKISTVAVAAAVPAAMGPVRRRHACHYRITCDVSHALAKKSGYVICCFSRPRELASCLASSQRSHDSLITVTGEAAVSVSA